MNLKYNLKTEKQILSSRRFSNPLISTITEFLVGIGLEVQAANISENTFLPGIMIGNGILFVDEGQTTYPGDILHEAGHMAVIPAAARNKVYKNVGPDAGQEMMAIAWSYAAVVHLHLDPVIVFHKNGYRGGSQSIIANFSAGRYVGVSGLEWLGMTVDNKKARSLGIAPYPYMIKWLCS